MADNSRFKNYTMIRVKKSVNEIARRKAATQNRSIANYVEHLIESDKTEQADIEGQDDGNTEKQQ